MAIRRSLASEIAELVAHLASSRPVERESAIARLSIIGVRAAGPLATVVEDRQASELARSGALAILSAMQAPRALDLARGVLREHPAEVIAREALEIVRRASFDAGRTGSAAFEQLTELALDRSAPALLRRASIEALQSHPSALVAPVMKALQDDPHVQLSAAAGQPKAPLLLDAALQLAPDAASTAIAQLAGDASPAALLRAIDTARANERREPDAADGWRLVQAQLHQALAARNSRAGLYDLRERFERAIEPLPLGFVQAAADIGDRSCLDSLARAWQAVVRPEDAWWRTQVARAFNAIAARERIGRQSAIMKKIETRWPGAQPLVAGVPRPARPTSSAAASVSTPSRTKP